ncbi:MAG: serine/threonine-protein kinase [Planctomycetaceae bacterium]
MRRVCPLKIPGIIHPDTIPGSCFQGLTPSVVCMNEPRHTGRRSNGSDLPASSEVSSADICWDTVARAMESFLEAWDVQGFGPRLADYLPGEPGLQRRQILIELIKIDLEMRHSDAGPVLKLEDYQDEYPEIVLPDGMPAELIYEEFHLRKSAGDCVDVNDCLQRFPEQAAAIRQHFQLEGSGSDQLTGEQLRQTWQPGDRLGDFYLMSSLGTGAFGSVFLARQESMQRMVALKVSSDRGQEAQTLAQLDHPNIVRVFDQTRLPEQNLRLLYMQFAAGGTLQSVIRRSQTAGVKDSGILEQCIADALQHTGVLSSDSVSLKPELSGRTWPEVTCQLGRELALALAYAHQQGVLHRDVKPANVLLDANGTARLADFNISFCSELDDTAPAAYFGGSLAYMSPEQLDACNSQSGVLPTDLDGRSDVFSLGILLWELRFGVRPFSDESVTGNWNETLAAMAELRRRGPNPPPGRMQGDVDRQLLSILKRCLQPELAERYQSAAELAQDLALCLQPRVAALLQGTTSGWRRWAIQHPLGAFLLASVCPHIPPSLFNFQFNDREIRIQLADAVQTFEKIAVTVNLVAFSIGFALCIRYCQPVSQRIRQLMRPSPFVPRSGNVPPLDVNPAGDEWTATSVARLRALRLSRFVTVLGIIEWMIAGLVYPIALQRLTKDLQTWWYGHFLISLIICGLIAAAYPFFLTATLAVRAFVPVLLRGHPITGADRRQLHRLSVQSAWSLYLAGGVPAAGTLVLLLTQNTTTSHSSSALLVLSVLGIFGFAFALSLSRTLQADIEALLEASRMLEASAPNRRSA